MTYILSISAMQGIILGFYVGSDFMQMIKKTFPS